jgi:hypothetical protein
VTCAVPRCQELSVTAGVCSAHWLEADEAAHGADRIEQEMRQARAEEAAEEARRLAMLEQARRSRPAFDAKRSAEAILNKICDRYWNDAGQGGRNNALAGAAWAAGRLVAGGELEEKETVQRLVTEAVASGLPLREAMDVVRGQFRHAAKSPRVLERKSEWSPQWAVKW